MEQLKKLHIDINNPEENIQKLIDYVIAEVWSAGGDGDCTVICKNYEAKELAQLLWNKIDNIEFKYNENGETITISGNQESFIFTNNINIKLAGWEQCIIII